MRYTWSVPTALLAYQIATPPVFTYGNTAREIVLELTNDGSPYILEGAINILMAIRNPNDFQGPALAELVTWTRTEVFGTYRGYLNLFTTEMQAFLANNPKMDALLQFTLTTGLGTQSSLAIPCVVQNYTANPNSGSPTPLPDPAMQWLRDNAVLYSESQSLDAAQMSVAQFNIGIQWDNADNQFLITTPFGVKAIPAF